MKKVFRVDLSMAVLAAMSLFTGIQIHYADHFQSFEIWRIWSIVHVIISIALLVMILIHVKQHKAFFKTLFNNIGIRKKVIMLLMMSFLIVLISGIILLMFIKGQGSSIGLVHWILGVMFWGLCLGHLAKRWKVFKKGVIG